VRIMLCESAKNLTEKIGQQALMEDLPTIPMAWSEHKELSANYTNGLVVSSSIVIQTSSAQSAVRNIEALSEACLAMTSALPQRPPTKKRENVPQADPKSVASQFVSAA